MTTRRLLPAKKRPARHLPDEAQGTPGVAIHSVTAEGGTAVENEKGDAMNSDANRLAALEMKTAAMAAQLIALQAAWVALVPLIRGVDPEDVRDAMRGACRDVVSTLEAARFDDATIGEVVRELQVISGELLDRTARPAAGYVARRLPC